MANSKRQPLSVSTPAAVGELSSTDLQSGQVDSAHEPESRETRIRLAAYAEAERRAFAPGFELEDWLKAESQVDAGSDEDSERNSAR